MGWSGTATEAGRGAISERLKRYFRQFTVIGVLLGLVVSIFAVYYMRQNGRMMDSIYHMQGFFDQIENIQSETGELLTLEQEGAREKLKERMEEAEADLRFLGQLQIAGNYRRNMEDLKRMFLRFREIYGGLLSGTEAAADGMQTLSGYRQSMSRMETVVEEELHAYYNRRRSSMSMGLRLLTLALVLSFCLSFVLIRMNTRELAEEIVEPIRRLTGQAEKIRADQLELVRLEPPVSEDTPPELTTLGEAYGHLLERIAEQMALREENIRAREALKEQELENLRIQHALTSSELKCLQMQMNPHFLFNTLNMIQQNLYMDKKEKTLHLLKETAAFLRYSLDYVGKTVTLEKELEGLGYYVDLQEERLGERIFFEFILDERIGGWRVPCLILQPLVENSIIHGVGQRVSGAQITIRTVYEEETGRGLILIEDNGDGIEAERLRLLRESLTGDSAQAQDRIGLHNVARRLELAEQGRGTLDIESEQGMGTRVRIALEHQDAEGGSR